MPEVNVPLPGRLEAAIGRVCASESGLNAGIGALVRLDGTLGMLGPQNRLQEPRKDVEKVMGSTGPLFPHADVRKDMRKAG